MANIPTVVKTVRASLRHYPSLYGRSHLRVLAHLFTTNGNGYDWQNGALYGSKGTSPARGEKSDPSWDAVLKLAHKMLVHDLDKYELAAKLQGKAHEEHLSCLCMLDRLYTPIVFYGLDTGDYSKLGHLPKDITDDWLAAAALTLLNVLHFRCNPRSAHYVDPQDHYDHVSEEGSQHREANHTNALILLCRYEQIFGKRKAWRDVIDHPEAIAPYYEGAKFWEIMERRDKQMLALSCKCSVHREKADQPYGFSEDPLGKLTAAEYLDYFEVDPTGFADLQLLAQLHHREWLARHERLKERMDRRKQDRALRRTLGEGKPLGKSLVIPATPDVLKVHHEWALLLSLNKKK